MSNQVEYPTVFNRLCHMVALSKEGKVKPAIDNLVVTALAINGRALTNVAQVSEAIEAYFSLSLSDSLVQSSIDRNLNNNRLMRHDSSKALILPPQVRTEIEMRVSEAEELEGAVRDEWLENIEKSVHDPTWNDELWNCTRAYMAKAFQQHGAETAQLLNPALPLTSENSKHLLTYLNEAIRDNCETVPRDVAAKLVQQFFASSTPLRTQYITQLLDGTFTFFALTVDEATSAYLRGDLSPLSLFLDTNFIFGILDLHTNPMSEISHELLGVIRTHKFPFTLYYHEETLLELQRTVAAIGDRLKARKWSQALSRAAIRGGQLGGIEQRYHEKNAESSLNAEIFLSKYEHIPDLLAEQGFKIYRNPPSTDASDNERFELVADYKDYVEQRRPSRPKPYNALNHDVAVWQTVKRLRKSHSTALNAEAFFLTNDYLFYMFDWKQLRPESKLGYVVLPNQLLQLLRPFIPATDDFNRRFVETFAIPQFRTVGGDYSRTHSKVLSYLSTYSDVSEDTAVRILANEMLMNELKEVKEDSDEFKEYIESALAQDNQELIQENEALQKRVEEIAYRAEQSKTLSEQKERERASIEAEKRKTDEALQQAKDSETEVKAKAETQDTELQKTREDLKRAAFMNRLIIGLAVGLFGLIMIIIVSILPWTWLEQHPQKEGLYGSVIAIIGSGVWAVMDRKRRSFAFGSLGIGAFLVLLTLVSG